MFEKGVAESEVVNVLIDKLHRGNLRNKLTVIDGYFLSDNRFGDTQRRIGNILEPFKGSVDFLEIITSVKHFNKVNSEPLSKRLYYLTVSVIIKNDFHDRFWIIDDRQAFVVGTSINSFGNKHFFIQDDFLSFNDTQTILSLYRE